MNNIYEYIAAKGKEWGVAPSPFGAASYEVRKAQRGPAVKAATLMGRVGGLGNGGGKLMTALQQGRGILS